MSEDVEATHNKLRALRQKNLNPEEFRLSDAELKKLDSSLKKNSAFIKKLKAFCDSNVESILKEVKTLNLSKYVSEAVQAVVHAVVEGKVKGSDMQSIIQICSALHQLYKDFTQDLISSLLKCFDVASVVEEGIAAQRQQMMQQQQLLLQGQQGTQGQQGQQGQGQGQAADKQPAAGASATIMTNVDKGIGRLKIVLR